MRTTEESSQRLARRAAMSETVETLVIWNGGAGRVEQAKEVRRQLEAQPATQLVQPGGAEEAADRVAEACASGTRRIITAGGDGTINSVINGLREAPPEVELGVLPLGTANDWCASLDIPNDLPAALELIRSGRSVPLDVAELTTETQTKRFANIATGGNSHRVTESISSEQKQMWGAMCYLVTGLSVLGDLESFDTTITWDDGSTTRVPVWNLIVANGQTSAGRIRIAPDAKLDDGLLDVVVIEEGTLIDVASLAGLYLFDEYRTSGKVLYRQARYIEVDATPTIRFSIDGDLVEEQPVRFEVIPQAIRVIVGPNACCS